MLFILCHLKEVDCVSRDLNEVFLLVFLQILVNSVSPNRPAVLYEKVTVSEGGGPLLRDMLFSPDLQQIYTLTDRQVSSLKKRFCCGLETVFLQSPSTEINYFLNILSSTPSTVRFLHVWSMKTLQADTAWCRRLCVFVRSLPASLLVKVVPL